MAESLSREAIVETTRRLITDEGLDAVSLRRVGSELGVTAPALYAYVADKEDLLRAVAEVEFGRLAERFATVTSEDPVERSRGYSREYIRHALENRELFRTMFIFPPDIGGIPPEGATLPAATETFNLALDATTIAIETGRYRSGLDAADIGLTTWAATHGLASVLLMGFEFDDASTDQLIDTLLDTVYRGLEA